LLNSKDALAHKPYVLTSGEEVMRVDIDTKIARVKELIVKREELDAELQELLGGSVKERRVAKCSACGEPGHRASTCPTKQTESVQ
jgi:hypothetical protein